MRRDARILSLIVSLALVLWGPLRTTSGCAVVEGENAVCAAACGCDHGPEAVTTCCCDHEPARAPDPAPAPLAEHLPDLLPGEAPRFVVPRALPPPPAAQGAPTTATLAPARAHPLQAELQVFLI